MSEYLFRIDLYIDDGLLYEQGQGQIAGKECSCCSGKSTDKCSWCMGNG